MSLHTVSDKSMRTSWYKHIAELNGGKVKLTTDPMAISFKYPGLSVCHYDREGNPDILLVMKFTMDARGSGFYIPYDDEGSRFIDWPAAIRGSLIFIASSTFTFSRTFYEHEFAKQTFDVTLSLGQVGNSSTSFKISLRPPGIDEPLVAHNYYAILVDKDTRLPVPSPEWFRTKYSDKSCANPLPKVNPLSKPKETYHRQVQVMWSATDTNNHTNFSSYVEYAINGIRYALQLKAGKFRRANGTAEELSGASQAARCLKGITGEILKCGLKSLRICYTKESKEGDVLDVHLWQEEGNAFVVYCVTEIHGEAACHIELEYFTSSSHL